MLAVSCMSVLDAVCKPSCSRSHAWWRCMVATKVDSVKSLLRKVCEKWWIVMPDVMELRALAFG